MGTLLAASSSLPACGLNEKECATLRSQAFEVLNEAHTCNSDAECIGSKWPGCTKPASTKNADRLQRLQAEFDKGGCKEPERDCRLPPEVYCKQGLCVFRELAGSPSP